jgi:hypothetical protein
MSRGVRLIAIVEDDEHRRFLLHLLKELRFHSRELRFLVAPAARGSASQWVVDQYCKEVPIHRSRFKYQRLALIAMVDADNRLVNEKFNECDRALSAAGHPERGEEEWIAVLIPKRNIETWIAHFVGGKGDFSDC